MLDTEEQENFDDASRKQEEQFKRLSTLAARYSGAVEPDAPALSSERENACSDLSELMAVIPLYGLYQQ